MPQHYRVGPQPAGPRPPSGPQPPSGIQPFGGSYTISFSEKSKGWVSFKTIDPEVGFSLNNEYYTAKNGILWKHHDGSVDRNSFYNTKILGEINSASSITVLFNDLPSTIKSFNTLNYEGSQARVTQDINDNPDYYDNFPKDGWYVKEMISNAQELGEMEFWDKEDKTAA